MGLHERIGNISGRGIEGNMEYDFIYLPMDIIS